MAVSQLRTTTLVPVFSTIFQLAVTVVIPLAVGQLICFVTNFKASSYPIAILGQIALLYIIFITFCQAFLNQDMQMNAHDILTTVLLGEFIAFVIIFVHCVVCKLEYLKYRYST
jgi:fucose 4-O-acetylase-like acetyltransferase